MREERWKGKMREERCKGKNDGGKMEMEEWERKDGKVE